MRDGEFLVIEAGHSGLSTVLTCLGLKREEDVPTTPDTQESEESGKTTSDTNEPVPVEKPSLETAQAGEVLMQELVVMPNSTLLYRSASDIELHTCYGIHLLAISRQGQRSIERLMSRVANGLHPG